MAEQAQSVDQQYQQTIALLEKEKYSAWKRIGELKKENDHLTAQVERLTNLLDNFRAE